MPDIGNVLWGRQSLNNKTLLRLVSEETTSEILNQTEVWGKIFLMKLHKVVFHSLRDVQLLWPRGLQPAMVPCPGVCSDSYPLSQWCHPTILSSFTPFSSSSTLLGIRLFSNELALPIRWLKYWGFSFSISPSKKYSGMTSFRIDWLPCCPMLSKGLSRIFSSTTFNYHFWDLCLFKKASMEQTCICQGDGWDKDGVGVWG